MASLTFILARASGETKAESLLHEIASWWLLLCGIVYIVAVSFSWRVATMLDFAGIVFAKTCVCLELKEMVSLHARRKSL